MLICNLKGVTDADLVLYVSQDDTTVSCTVEEAVAHAGSCRQDQYGRPVFGTLNLCSEMIPNQLTGSGSRPKFWKSDVLITTHQVAHIMIMSSFLWGAFWDPTADNGNGDTRPTSEVYTLDSNGERWIITENVRTVSRDHFNCDTLIGAPVENDTSHWDGRFIQSENLNEITFDVNEDFTFDAVQYMSIFTFALMQDSGTYFVDASQF